MTNKKFDAVEIIGVLVMFLAAAAPLAWALINLFS